MEYLGFTLLLLAALLLTTLGGLLQHRHYAKTVQRLAREYNRPGLVLVSGTARGRLRGAAVILVLRRDREVVERAYVMEGSSSLARFRDKKEWIGLSTREPLPSCSTKVAEAVKAARKQIPAIKNSGPTGSTRSSKGTQGGSPHKA
jgi:glucitol operon activator protein